MPEGDSVHRHAAELRPLLVGKPLRAAYSRGLPIPRLAGATVVAVEPRGKHLLIETDRGFVAHVHLGMTGGWRRLRAPLGDAWRLRTADLALVTDGDVLLCRARTVELMRAQHVKAHPALAALGPDLLGDRVDLDDVVRRARALDPAAPIADVLLDQKVAAGVGNVYKSEVLFIEKLHPHTPIGALDDEAVRRVYARARAVLAANLGSWQRTTTADASRGERPAPGRGRTWVYRRRGRACYRCGAAIAGELVLPLARQTFWCPRCQPDAR
jgi:endonuclease-8